MSKEFYWNPNDYEDIWTSAYRHVYSFGEDCKIDIKINEFNGDPNNLQLELLTNDGSETVTTFEYLETVEETSNHIIVRFTYTERAEAVTILIRMLRLADFIN